MILDYLIKFHINDLLHILSEKDNLAYYCVKIDFIKLFETYPDVGDKVLCSPVESLKCCDQELIKAQQKLLELNEHKHLLVNLEYTYLKRNVHARFFGLPVCPELHRTIFPKNVDLGCFLKVTGTVIRVTQVKMLEYQRKYVCAKCKFENCVEAEFENRYVLKAPPKCGNSETRCRCATFTPVNMVSREYCKDYQEIKIQEQVNKLSIGSLPGSMWVVLENDLVDSCKPGDDVNICASVRRRWKPSVSTKKSDVELVLHANYIEVCNAQRSQIIATAPDIKDCFDEFWSKYQACPLKGRDQILMGVCPQVYGLYLVKLALLLTVITGSNHVAEDDSEKRNINDDKHSMRVRGQCHLLLVGDPGTGKSQLLRCGVKLTPRSVFTSGAGSTQAGLTCAALKEDGEWQLEAGALVLSDGGVCCIDEISQLREHDRCAIHEAMEQQTISIAKAGIVCKLNTRCAIIAACNPKGHYQTDEPLSVNVSLGTPLLSRFDLIFILLDSKNKVWDKLVSSYILFGGSSTESKKSWDIEKLQLYISLVGPKRTEMTKNANIILQSYYMMQRKSENRDASRTTVRMLDSLVRLSQAHCRLMFRTKIHPLDAIVAISLVDLSMQDCTLNETEDALHSTFYKYPDFDYLCTAKKILTKLNLSHIWMEELLYYGKLMQVDHKTLENEIDNGSYQLFTKFDNVIDDSVSLTPSLITSSYFNNKKYTTDDKNIENIDKNDEQFVNKKFVETLKKHSNLNKSDTKVPKFKAKKRKRKEVTVDTVKLSKKVKSKKNKTNISIENSESDEDFENDTTMLNQVPSVNDAFNDLGIDMKIICDNHDNTEKETVIPQIIQIKQESEISTIEDTHKKSINILNQFKYTENRDLSKFFEEKTDMKKDLSKLESTTVVRLNEIKTNVSSTSRTSSSQLSIFETTDCDIDLDI